MFPYDDDCNCSFHKYYNYCECKECHCVEKYYTCLIDKIKYNGIFFF